MVNFDEPQVQAALIAAIAVVVSSLLTLIISSHYSRSSLFQEWVQRNKEWQREMTRRDRDWTREKIIEFYSGAVFYLKKLSMSAKSADPDRDKQVRQHVAESYRYIDLLEMYKKGLRSRLSTPALDLDRNLDIADDLARAADSTLAALRQEFEKDPILITDIKDNS
ncbi:hypothetical protein ACCS62_28440 [Rhizobium ruizarguesonis]